MSNMTRTQLIATAKEQGIKDIDGKPVHMVKSQVIQEAIQNLIPEAKVTMKSRILELGRQGMNKKTIADNARGGLRSHPVRVHLRRTQGQWGNSPQSQAGKKAQVTA